VRLSHAERWILVNQYEILRQLHGGEKSLYEMEIEILTNGYQDEYEYAAQYVRSSVIGQDVSAEVKDILGMFNQMQWVKAKANLSDKRHQALFTFWGFDGNNSSEHLAYADFLLRRGDFRDLRLRNCPNSHSDTLNTYRAMVNMWKGLGMKGLRMSAVDIHAILDAPILLDLELPKRLPDDSPDLDETDHDTEA
jgi:uncharacterized protein YfbU (UPF0304 family)